MFIYLIIGILVLLGIAAMIYLLLFEEAGGSSSQCY
jgi:hypothetical protein